MGTPGHMAHPFDVDRVKTGQDLIDYINDAVLRLQNQEISGSVKWDGINTSFKLITTEDGKKEFRMDRGTSEIGSVIGFNAESALEKWGTEHGMTQAIVKLLQIFDKSLPLIKSELKELGMWDDPTKYFNTEYIEGQSNVQEYEQNILAIHSINQFYEKSAQEWRKREGTSMDRPGLERPIDPKTDKPVRGSGIEIPYNKDALASLIKKVQPIAAKAGFEVYGDVPVEFDPDTDLDLDKVLDTPVSIQITPGGRETNPLGTWLQMVEHPQNKKVTRADGKSVGALSKDVYMAVLRSAEEGGIPLSEYLASKEDVTDAINGALMYHGTRLLGQAVKNALHSKAGSVGGHEGVVLRGMEDFLVKLTGDFIVQGLASTHGERSHLLPEVTQHSLNWAKGLIYEEIPLVEARYNPDWRRTGYQPRGRLAPEEESKRVIAVYPGRFQPMGRHHFQTYQQIATEQGIDDTYVATSNKVALPKSPLNFEQKKDIMLMHGVPENQIIKVKNPYDAVELSHQYEPGTVEMVYFVGAKDMASNPRFQKTSGVTKDGYDWRIKVAPHAEIDIPGIGEMSGTTLRKALAKSDPETFEEVMGWFNQDIYDMLQNNLNLQEMSAMGGGAVAGYAGREPDVSGSEKKKKRHPKNFLDEEEMVTEVIDYLLGITVG